MENPADPAGRLRPALQASHRQLPVLVTAGELSARTLGERRIAVRAPVLVREISLVVELLDEIKKHGRLILAE